ncbi:hypothetical protein FQZ97_874450 [compost metagenome]
MIDVERHAEHAGLARIEFVAQVERMLERVDAGAVGRLHRVQGLDGQRHADLARVVERGGDAVAHLAARAGDVLVRRLAVERAGQGADDQHEAGRVERLGLVDGAAVVVERGLQAGRVGRGKEAAPAVAREADAVRLQLLRHLVEPDGRDLVAPRADGADAAFGALVDEAVQRHLGARLLADGRRVDRQPVVVLREIAHGFAQPSTPCKASNVFMRRTASSGCSSRLAASARRKSSAKCCSERVLCCPPTIVKCFWWPLSQAMNTTPVL